MARHGSTPSGQSGSGESAKKERGDSPTGEGRNAPYGEGRQSGIVADDKNHPERQEDELEMNEENR